MHMPRKSSALAQKASEIIDGAFDEGRELTPSERGKCEALLNRAREANELEGALRELNGDAAWQHGDSPAGKGHGDLFIESKGYKDLMARGLGSGTFTTGQVELQTKGTLATTPGTALTPAGYVPGVVETLYQRPYISDLVPNAQAPGNPVRYVSETTATNAAAAVAETGLKPESTLVFGEVSEPVRKVATLLPISDEMLEDAPQIQAYLNQRLSLFVRTQEEAQLLLGTGTAPNLQGFVASGRTIGTYARGTVDDNALALFKAANGVRGSSFLDPDTVVIHPTNWQAIRTAKDSSGQYYGGGPFYAGYGGPQGPASASQFSADNLWGMRVVVTSAITVGTALVGAFGQGAAIWRKGGLRVEATNSHSTYFASDITVLRAESRLALGVFRPSAFVATTGLS